MGGVLDLSSSGGPYFCLVNVSLELKMEDVAGVVGNVSESCAVLVSMEVGILWENMPVSCVDCIAVQMEVQVLIWNIWVGGVDFDFDFGALKRIVGEDLKVREMKNFPTIAWHNAQVGQPVVMIAIDDAGMFLVVAMEKDGPTATATVEGRNPFVSTRRCPGEASVSPHPFAIPGWHRYKYQAFPTEEIHWE